MSPTRLKGVAAGFRLGQWRSSCGVGSGGSVQPFGEYFAKSVYIPSHYDLDQTTGAEFKCHDWAILELQNEIDDADAHEMVVAYYDSFELIASGLSPYSVGYPAKFGGGPSLGKAVSVGGDSKILLISSFPSGQLMHLAMDASGGQSGSPVYLYGAGTRWVFGTLVGQPNTPCAPGAGWSFNTSLWSTLFTSVIAEQISDIVDKGITPLGIGRYDYASVPPDSPPPMCA